MGTDGGANPGGGGEVPAAVGTDREQRLKLMTAFERLEGSRGSCLALVDVDGLGVISAMYGPPAGDDALRLVEGAVHTMLQGADVAIRWADDAWAVIFPGRSEAEAAAQLTEVLRMVRETPLPGPWGGRAGPVTVTFSAGVVHMLPALGIVAALKGAEQALFLAKSSGRCMVMPGSRANMGRQRVMLVEDDPVMARLVTGLLEANGLETVHFTDGAQAVASAEAIDVGLVILDILLPGINGYDVLINLRRMPRYMHCPVLMLSGMRRPEEISRGFNLGGSDYLVKPFAPVEFHARVRRLMEGEREARSIPGAGPEGEGGDGHGNHDADAWGPG